MILKRSQTDSKMIPNDSKMIPNVFAKVQLFFKFHVVGHASTNNIKSIIHRPAEGPTTAAAAVAAAAREIRGLAPQLHHY